MKWNKRNRWTVIVAACITVLFVIWLWGFTHPGPAPEEAEVPQEQPEAVNEEPDQEREQRGQDSDGRYLPSSEETAKEPAHTPEASAPDRPEPEEADKPPKEPEPAVEGEKPSEKDAPGEEDVPDWKSGWKEPEWPEWPEWSERNTIPRRTVTGTVGSVPRWDDR